jgi:hypothetical protein
MRFSNIQYLEKEVVTVSCRNNNASAIIIDGQPVFYDDFNTATNFGVDVKNTSVPAGAIFAGIAKWNKLAGTTSTLTGAAVGDVFEAVCYGFTDAIVSRRVRAASTDTWASVASTVSGAQYALETTGGNITPSVVSQGALIVGVESNASIATAASTYGGTALADGLRMKVFVRSM